MVIVDSVVRLLPGETLTADALLAFLSERLSAIELPKIVEFRSELPKSAIGKILKTELIAEHLASQQGAGDARSTSS